MDSTDLLPLAEDLGGSIEDLEESLGPLLRTALSNTSSKLPLLDKAKLYVLATYAIESVLFSALRLNGVDAKKHPVFLELSRVKEYFDKIKIAESGPPKRPAALDKDAAARFVRQGLSGNDRYDRERAERTTKEQTAAKRRADELERSGQWDKRNRFAGAAKRMRSQEQSEMIPIVKANEDEDDEEDGITGDRGINAESGTGGKARIRKFEAQPARQKTAADVPSPEDAQFVESNAPTARTAAGTAEAREGGPRGHRETFEALLQGPIPRADETFKKKKKRKSRGEIRQQLEDTRASEMR